MPVLVPLYVPPPPSPAPPGPPAGVPLPPASWEWTSPRGVVRNLSTGTSYLRPGGIAGHLSAPIEVWASDPPTIDGGIYRGHRYAARDMVLGLTLVAPDPTTWRSETRALVRDFNTTTGDGVLTLRYFDAETRSIRCRYVGGLESPDDGDQGAVFVGKFTVQVRAYDPFWYGTSRSLTFTASAGSTNLYDNSPPFTISSGELIGSPAAINNPGDVPSYPVWTIYGPTDEVTIENADGDSFTVSKVLADSSQWVRIDTDPRTPANQKIVDYTGANLWGTATSDFPNLFALPPGDSEVTITVISGTPSVRLDWTPRYETA